jgi:predicted dinucleotide-binding enzyme
MNFGIFGTGMVGQTIAGKLADLGNSVVIGTRDVSATLANTSPNAYGLPPFSAWYNRQVKKILMAKFLLTFLIPSIFQKGFHQR